MMSQTEFEGRWQQLRDKITEFWPKLNDSDVAEVAGRYERLISLLQAKYVHSRRQAAADVDRWMAPRGIQVNPISYRTFV